MFDRMLQIYYLSAVYAFVKVKSDTTCMLKRDILFETQVPRTGDAYREFQKELVATNVLVTVFETSSIV